MSLSNSSDVNAGDDINATDHNELRDDIDESMPTGSVVMWVTATAPAGWVLCDGTTGLDSTVDTSLAALFAVIGTTYGGTGAADFDLPDMRGNLPLGRDNMGGSSRNRVTNAAADTIGSEAGAETHTLVSGEIPSHTHTMGYANGTSSGSSWIPQPYQKATRDGSLTGDATGGGGAHENMSLYMTFAYIMKK